MKRWALLVVALYGFIIIILTVPMLLAAFIGKTGIKGAAGTYLTWQFWTFLIVMLVSQIVFLVVPIDIANKRPITKRRLIFPVITSGLMIAGLVVGLVVSISEFFIENNEMTGLYLGSLGSKDSRVTWTMFFKDPTCLRAVGVLIFAWLLWALIFYRWTKHIEPKNFIERQCRYLFAGSILELLVAVPAHVIARHKDYCCAGFSTYLGISLGLAVMLFSFGPGVFFLYTDRWKRLHPEKTESGQGAAI
jgi:hypothetical protein